jgi:hypothetical protein
VSSRHPDRQASRAVLIGVGTYDHPERLHHIPAAANNLADLHQLLTAPSGSLSTQNCWTVANPASSAQIGHILEDAAEQATDTLLVYYTGHGVLDRRGRLHLALTGTHPDRTRWTALPFSTLREAILDSPATTRILILDCCFSGRAFEALSDGPDAVLGQADIAGTYTITSSARNETSFAPTGERHTAFTAALLAAAAGTPGLPLDDLYTHTHRHLQRHGHPRPQRRATNAAGRIILFPDTNLAPPPLDELERTLTEHRKSLGPNHPDTLSAGHELARRVADAGNSNAMNNLGALLNRRGDPEQAEIWFRRAVDAGDGEAMNNLGALLNRRGDPEQAEIWFRRAVDAGHTDAMNNLGILLAERGELDQAEAWFQKAADTEDSDGDEQFPHASG